MERRHVRKEPGSSPTSSRWQGVLVNILQFDSGHCLGGNIHFAMFLAFHCIERSIFRDVLCDFDSDQHDFHGPCNSARQILRAIGLLLEHSRAFESS